MFEFKSIFNTETSSMIAGDDALICILAALVCKENNIPVEILKEPFRWCEDFGQFLKQTEGSIFGLGNGIDSEGLHTDNYEFNDEIITNAWTIFKGLI